jgi:hypothetical protein
MVEPLFFDRIIIYKEDLTNVYFKNEEKDERVV